MNTTPNQQPVVTILRAREELEMDVDIVEPTEIANIDTDDEGFTLYGTEKNGVLWYMTFNDPATRMLEEALLAPPNTTVTPPKTNGNTSETTQAVEKINRQWIHKVTRAYLNGMVEHEDPETIANTTEEQRIQDFALFLKHYDHTKEL